ncbi:MAG: GNAT family N-acetyltransferase [Verrucomicrobiales bacterium]
MEVSFASEPGLSPEEFRDVLNRSTLGKRRPVDDLQRLEQMIRGADLVITAREGSTLVGISRAITDFAFCCYLSDLAVAQSHQRMGIGKRLIEETHKAAGLQTSLFLVSAPAAIEYYPRIGMKSYPCFGIGGKKD